MGCRSRSSCIADACHTVKRSLVFGIADRNDEIVQPYRDCVVDVRDSGKAGIQELSYCEWVRAKCYQMTEVSDQMGVVMVAAYGRHSTTIK